MLLNFINREAELNFLENQHSSKNASFIVVYGRRRVGKTALISRFIEKKPSFYYLCKKQNLSLELERFAEKFSETFNVHLSTPQSFEGLFSDILGKIDPREKFVLAIDEFTYWIEQDKSILSTFQVIWDELLSKKNVMLILSGSIVSLMETEVLGYKSPLYGRRTGQWEVTPLSFFTLCKFFPEYSPESLVKVYSCTNCIPQYLLQFDPKRSFEENINQTFFQKGNILYEEGEFLLMEELRQIETYLNIILAVSQGATKLSEIASKSKVDVTNILKYLKVLVRLGVIKKVKPVTVRKEKTKNAVFRVSDKFFRFWTTFVYPYKAEIERDIINFTSFKDEFSTYLGSVFEDVAEEFFVEQNRRRALPFSFTKIGKEWGKIPLKSRGENAYDIDLVALNEQTREILFCECKWQDVSRKDAEKLIEALKQKASYVSWNQGKRKEHFGLFARKIEGKAQLRKSGILAWDLDDCRRS